MLKGKLTYTSLAVMVLASAGLSVTVGEIDALYAFGLHAAEVVGLIGAIYGRWRANRR